MAVCVQAPLYMWSKAKLQNTSIRLLTSSNRVKDTAGQMPVFALPSHQVGQECQSKHACVPLCVHSRQGPAVPTTSKRCVLPLQVWTVQPASYLKTLIHVIYGCTFAVTWTGKNSNSRKI